MPTPVLTVRQLVEAVSLFNELGNKTEAGSRLGISRDAFRHRLNIAKERGLMDPPQESHSEYKSHCVIPDCQVKPGVPLDHLKWAGKYIADKKPDVIVVIGDFADMPSLSSYDKGKRSAENKRYKYDIEAVHKAMELLMTPIVTEKDYHPRLIMTLGNHENRIVRMGDDNPELHDTLSLKDLGYEAWGFEVYPFLKVVEVDGVEYSHYFTTGVMGRAANSAAVMLRERQRSCTMGHSQYYDMAIHKKTQQRALMSGCFYQHDEDYLGPQGNDYRRHLIFKHEVREGRYDLLEVSLEYLRRRYA